MSIEAMNHVWKNSNYLASWSYVLLAIADVVNDLHDNAFYMSVPSLAQKCKCSVRSIQTALREFEKDGWITETVKGGGRMPSTYTFNLITPAVQDLHPSGADVCTPAVQDGVSIPTTYTNSKTNLELNYSEDIISLGEFFADSLVALGCKRPNISKAWLTEFDRMVRIDERTPEQIKKAIQWAHADPFWSTNILSPAKLRKQYETLRLKASAERTKPLKGLAAVQEYARTMDAEPVFIHATLNAIEAPERENHD